MATVAAPSMNTPKNFHDSIRSMFSGIGAAAATSTTSLAYTLEHGAKTNQTLLVESTKFHTVALKLLEQQTGLLKKLVSGGSGGGGGGLLDTVLDGILGEAEGVAEDKAKGIGKRLVQKLFGPLFTKIGEKVGISAAITFVTRMRGNMVRGLERTAEAGGKFIVKAVGRAALGAFDIVASAGRAIFKPLIGLKNVLFSSGIFKGIAEVVGKFAGGGIVKIFGKLLWPLTAIMAVFDGVTGWMNSDKLLGKSDGASTFTDKIASAAGSIVNGLLLGIPNWLLDTFGGTNIQKVFAGAKDWLGDVIPKLGKGLGKLLMDGLWWQANLLPRLFKAAFNAVGAKDVGDKVYGIFETVKNALWSGLTYISNSVKDAITNAFADMWASVKDWWNAPQGTKPPAFHNGRANAPASTGGYSRGAANSTTVVKPTSSGVGGGGASVQQISYSGSTPSAATDASAATAPGMATVGSSSGSSGGGGGGGGNAVGQPSATPVVSATGNPGTLAGGGASENAKCWYSFFPTPLDKGGMGYTSEQAKGFVATMQGESGKSLNSSSYNPDDNGGPSGGTAQWHDKNGKGRLTNLKNFAASQGKDWTDVATQQQFMKTELLGSHAHVDRAIRGASTAQEAVDIAVRKFEVPQYPDKEVQVRSGNLAGLSTLGTVGSSMPLTVDQSTPSAARASANSNFIPGKGLATPSQLNNMGGFLNGKSLDLLSKVNPDLAATVLNAQKYMPAGQSFQLSPSTIRTLEQQQQFVAQGKSQTMNSNHLTGRAADILPYGPDGKPLNANKDASYVGLTAAMKRSAQELGVATNWGGDWKGFKDSDHFELNRKYKDSGGALLAKVLGGGNNGSSTPTAVDMAVNSNQQRAIIQSPLSTKAQSATPAFEDAYSATAKMPSVAPPVPVDTRNTNPVAADSSGNKGGGNAIPGSFKVGEIPVVDEYKMLLANGSRLT